ncbi:MAG: hypothetical protein ABI862_21225, partial [Ilumatobacteraceae bacterium]
MILVVLVAALSSLMSPLELRTPESITTQRAGDCLLAINGRDVRDFADADDALRLNVHDTVQIDALSSEATTTTRIAVDLPVGPSIPVKTFRHQSSQRFTESLQIADISSVGVGWYHIEVDSGPCSGAFWVRVYGRSPLTTVIGIGAVLVLAVGAALLVLTLVRSRRPRRSLWWGGAAGILIGIALFVLAQQFSVVAFTPIALALFLGGGAAGGAGAAGAAGAEVGVASSPEKIPPDTIPPGTIQPGTTPSPPLTPAHALPPPPPPGVAPGREPTADPPRRAYARIECDDVLLAGAAFDLTVGLSPTPVSGVVGP